MVRVKYRIWDSKTKRFTEELIPTEVALQRCLDYKDGAGYDIFEGDIIRATTKAGITVVSEVKFFPEYGVYALKEVPHYCNRESKDRPLGSSGSSTAYKPFNWKSYKKLEVIGNICENADLLK